MTRIVSILLALLLCAFTTPGHIPATLAYVADIHEHHDCNHHHYSLWERPFADRDGTPAEKTDAFNKIEAYRTANALTSNTQRGKNIGYVEGSITNAGVTKSFTINNTAAISNSGLIPEPNIFTATIVGGYLRITDSEYQMLSLLAKNNYSAVRGSVFTGATGTLKIVSERIYCASCNDVCRVQFKRMFPNVNLIFISGTT
jgi:hypothetical protein